MSGGFPTGIVHIPYLQVVKFTAGSMTGPLPSGIIEGLKNLRVIDLQVNEFTGEIPKEWWEAKKLASINLAYNQIEGTISTAVQHMKDLKWLNIHDNKLSGPIPTEIGSIPNLEQLRLGRNDLTGPIPTEFGQLTGLTDLWLDQNLLTGTLPVEMSNMTMLDELSLGENPKLGGIIPDEFYTKWTKMSWLELYSCNFTGPISPLIGNMKGLYVLLLNDNSFTGVIPEELAILERLEVQNNKFQGRMPDEVCDQRVGSGHVVGISTLVADCAPNPKTGQVELSCDCCTKCCTPGGACSKRHL
jgi:Leucine-rich repeat (LRR) protein